MDQLISLATIVPWIDYFFPSLSQYTKFVIPAFMAFATFMGIFTNYLPEPGTAYPIPDVSDLKVQLGDSGKFILRMAIWVRSVTIGINWFLASSVYKIFYTSTNAITKVLVRLKGGTPKAPTK
jgi:hypothetical protein